MGSHIEQRVWGMAEVNRALYSLGKYMQEIASSISTWLRPDWVVTLSVNSGLTSQMNAIKLSRASEASKLLWYWLSRHRINIFPSVGWTSPAVTANVSIHPTQILNRRVFSIRVQELVSTGLGNGTRGWEKNTLESTMKWWVVCRAQSVISCLRV